MQYASLTLKGPRADNQDSFHIQSSKGLTFACVADGVGGNSSGCVASKVAVNEVMEAIDNGAMLSLELFISIDRTLKQKGAFDKALEGMASTLSVCVVSHNRLFVGHCGDSRIMLLRNKGIQQLTQDHTEVEKLLNEGVLNKQEALEYPRKNVLESALGAKKELLYFGGEFEVVAGDRVLLTTDGVHGVFSKKELRDISLQSLNPEEFIRNITTSGLESRISDNATLIVIDI